MKRELLVFWLYSLLFLIIGFTCSSEIDPSHGNTKSVLFAVRTADRDISQQTEYSHCLDFRYAPDRWQTCIGLPDDPYKSMVGSDGGLYYDYSSNGLYHDFNSRILVSMEDDSLVQSTQRLFYPRVPVVNTEQEYSSGITLTQTAWANAPDETLVTEWSRKRRDILWIQVAGTTGVNDAGSLVINVGFRDSLEMSWNMSGVLSSTRELIRLNSPPDEVRKTRTELSLHYNLEQFSSGCGNALFLEVFRGEDAETLAPVTSPEEELERAIDYWQSLALPYDKMLIPDSAMQALLQTSIRNLYQARELRNGVPMFQVGPTMYRGVWAVDGAFISEALTYLGRIDEVRAMLSQQLDEDQGPGGIEFSKKAGLRLWTIWRHAALTGDTTWLKSMWPRVEREVENIQKYRKMTRDDPEQPNYGLMPAGYTDGGIWWKHREYSNVYWTLTGLKYAVHMAKTLDNQVYREWEAEYRDYRKVFNQARRRDTKIDKHGHEYLPTTMTGEEKFAPQRGQWAFLHSIYPGKLYSKSDSIMRGTLAMLDAHQKEGLIHGTGWLEDGIWTVAGSLYGHAHLWLGHRKDALSIFYAFANHAAPTLVWREEQPLLGAEDDRYVGDMPHNWGSAECIRMIRHMLIFERGNELHLLESIPESWISRGNSIHMDSILTAFGPVSLDVNVHAENDSVTVKFRLPERSSLLHRELTRVVLHLEKFERHSGDFLLNSERMGSSEQRIEPGATVVCKWRGRVKQIE